jgi:WhiB family redox-sensing transcriptional regulator
MGPMSQNWMVDALCRGTQHDFFSESQAEQRFLIREFCDRCPVRPQCLDIAIKNDEEFGVWGGWGEAGRRRVAVDLLASRKEMFEELDPIVSVLADHLDGFWGEQCLSFDALDAATT